jgi:hypothetical protein
MTRQGIFYYYVPGKDSGGVTQDDLRANPFLAVPFADLIHSPLVFRDTLLSRPVASGPDGGKGCVIAVRPQVDDGQRPSYQPQSQTWQRFGNEKLGYQWIGYDTATPPGPNSLRRKNQIPGADVELGDRRIWSAPQILSLNDDNSQWEHRLPVLYQADEKLRWSASVQPRYLEVFEAAKKVIGATYHGAPVTVGESLEWSLLFLAVNYRVGAAESSLLGIMSTHYLASILHAAIGEAGVEQLA